MDTTLTYVGNGSDKFYRILTVAVPGGRVQVRTEYGPNSRRDRPNKGLHFTGDALTANGKARELQRAKERKGYRVESAKFSYADDDAMAALPPKPPTKAALAKKARATKAIASLQTTCNAVLL